MKLGIVTNKGNGEIGGLKVICCSAAQQHVWTTGPSENSSKKMRRSWDRRTHRNGRRRHGKTGLCYVYESARHAQFKRLKCKIRCWHKQVKQDKSGMQRGDPMGSWEVVRTDFAVMNSTDLFISCCFWWLEGKIGSVISDRRLLEGYWHSNHFNMKIFE